MATLLCEYMYSTAPQIHLQDFSPSRAPAASGPGESAVGPAGPRGPGSSRAAGIDGCRGGWFAVLVEGAVSPGGRAPLRVADTLLFDAGDYQALSGILDGSSLGLIDIPIGLPARGERKSDAGVRGLLGSRRGSIFPMPVRAAVYAATYEEACRINAEATGKKLSKQAWNILGKVRSIDRFLRMREEYRLCLRESSPEYCFALAAAGLLPEAGDEPSAARTAPLYGKRTPEGIRERSDILAGYIHDWDRVRAEVRASCPRTRLSDDDILDAGILAVSAYFAGSGDTVLVPGDPEYDEHGLPIQAVFGTPGKGMNISFQKDREK